MQCLQGVGQRLGGGQSATKGKAGSLKVPQEKLWVKSSGASYAGTENHGQ